MSPRQRVALLAAILTGFALRLVHLGAESLWYDEPVSVMLARKSLPAMWLHTAGDIHPPGYYFLLHLWQLLTQPSLAHGLEFLYAWPGVFFGMLILPLIFILSRRWYGRTAAVLTIWLAAVNPLELWYSQEVRMYTLGAALGLLALWAALRYTEHRQWRWAVVYVLAAAAGLYTLYYFLLVLAAVNLVAAILLWRTPGRWGNLARWAGLQLTVVVVWMPWIPNFYHQVIDPPVPPWRTPWTQLTDVLMSVAETLAAPLVGQSAPAGINWPWAVASAGLLVMYGVVMHRGRQGRLSITTRNSWIAPVYVFLPVATLFAITAVVTPIYHVRYFFLYSPPLLAMLGAVCAALLAWQRWWGVIITTVLLVASAIGLYTFWNDPELRADDHRSAVASLAAGWRPGDVILANAGWIYPILEVYWPQAGAAIAPPAPLTMLRLADYAHLDSTMPAATPLVVRTGSIDGNAQLGWNNPNADFFPITTAATLATLNELASHYQRIWHYRLYDTVADPAGAIRTWLDANTSLLSDQPIAGRDFGRLQLFQLPGVAALPANATPDDTPFGDALTLAAHTLPPTVTPGRPLYVNTWWQANDDLARMGVDLSSSLRLYDAAGALVAQQDGPFLPASSQWPMDQFVSQVLRVDVPPGTPPGAYSVQLVVYWQDNGAALPVPEGPQTIEGQRRVLGQSTVAAQ
ncbi:MAG: glycosyltransferase family 39 protein [Anaerolineales bacterium]|nr:glycosyltransferase family 39 protein [Anaerolineales bacterium]